MSKELTKKSPKTSHFKRKSAFICGALFSLICSLVIFHRALACFGVEWYARSKFGLEGKISFSYEKCNFGLKHLCLHGVSFLQLSPNGDDRVKVEVERLDLAFEELFAAPRCGFYRPTVAFTSPFSFEQKEWDIKRMSIPFPIKVEEGVLVIGKEGKVQTSFNIDWKGSQEGGFIELREREDKRAPLLKIEMAQKEQGKHLFCTFDHFNLYSFFEAARFFTSSLDETILVEEGQIDGHLDVKWDSFSEIEWMEGDLAIINLQCQVQKYGATLAARRIHWKQDESQKIAKTHPLFERFFPFFGGEGELFGGVIHLIDPHSRERRVVAEIGKGRFQFREEHKPLFSMRGDLKGEEGKTPFSLTMGGWVYGQGEWKVAVDVKTHSRLSEAMSAYVALSEHAHRRYFAELDCRRIRSEYVQVIKGALEGWIPELEGVDLHLESVDATLTGWIEEAKLSRCEVRHFLARNCLMTWPAFHAEIAAAHVQGHGEFDWTKSSFFEAGYWECEAHQGSLELEKKTIFEEMNIQFAMHDRYVKPSHMTARMGQAEISLQFEGLLSHLNIDLDVGCSVGDLVSFSQTQGKIPLDLDEKIALQFDVQLQEMSRYRYLDGTCDLSRIKGKDDHIEFGLQFDAPHVETEGMPWEYIKRMFRSGWFRAEELSAQTVNLPLYFFGRDWHGEGTIDIEGSLTADAIEFSIDPTHLIYCSPDVIAYYPSAFNGRAERCSFHYDVKREKWEGTIPLRGAELRETSFGLIFKELTTELTLKEKMLFSEHMEACSEGITLLGSVSIDHSPPEHAELKLDISHFEGSASGVRTFLTHFDVNDRLNIPFNGRVVSGEEGMYVHAYFGAIKELLAWDFALHLKEGHCALSSSIECDGLEAKLSYSKAKGELVCKEIGGAVALKQEGKVFPCHLNIPSIALHFIEGFGEFDVRLETPIYDMCRFKGGLQWGEEGLVVAIDPHSSHSFGAVGEISTLVFDLEGRLAHLDLEATLSALDLYQHMELLSFAGVIPIKLSHLEKIQSPLFDGKLTLQCHYHGDEELLSFGAQSEKLVLGLLQIDQLEICGERHGQTFNLDQCHIGNMGLTLSMEKQDGGWAIPCIDVQWGKHTLLQGADGNWNQKAKQLKIPLNYLGLDLQTWSHLFLFDEGDALNSLFGTCCARGVIDLDFSQGIKGGKLDCVLEIDSKEKEGTSLCLKSTEPLHVTLDGSKGLCISNAHFDIVHSTHSEIWAKCSFQRVRYLFDAHEWKGEGIHLTLPPEIVQFLATTSLVPHVTVDDHQLLLVEHPITWNNQIKADIEFTKRETWCVNGRLEEGYYWLGNRLWELKECFFSYSDQKAGLRLYTHYQEIPFEVGLELSLMPHPVAELTIWEISSEGPLPHPLKVHTGWNDQEGFFIQKVSGKSCGLDFSFHHNPKHVLLDQMVLTGQVKIDVPSFSKFLPDKFRKVIETLEVGKGYELSGDVILSKEKLDRSHFIGYLKGKSFELLGSELETLLSKIAIYPHHIELKDFSLSDAAGIFTVNQLWLEEFPDKGWHLAIPKLSVQDFRPSLLKKIGNYRGRIKPLTIRNLTCYNLCGDIGNLKTFTGQGNFYFINTFKRNYNLLDIPLEIIGRIGLDMGLLIPVRGEVKYSVANGKVSLIELENSYSEGKRSQFFLSHSRPSYVDFEGNLNINIRMKQYVLLKLTEPFTLSIAGTFDHPRYALN